ncbi:MULTISPECIES: protein-disulfide reductase DsbD [unclassified Duganella]|uniref:protein-disulfide reductase DsbD n=1 Tax=unclassified Duganella TaxID=2636909 RepID=UPI000E34B28B|nr:MULTISPECIES: protein-disulfide reductase DsbD [unclassified Duganella]RFP10181.1 protein-disulfide reductase DsbD [Duganella sp. BJB475]RFP25513.1 protein-disulfide reductase DsbD [Duganella sp. BJB476]
MLRIARLLLPLLSLIAMLMARPALADDGFLEPELAFKFSARMVDGHTVSVSFQIADGYYMYRERFKFSANGAKLGALSIPAGTVHFDETFQKNVETYRKTVTMTLPVEADGPFTLMAVGQGCSDKGLCYAPQDYKIQLVASGSVPLPAAPAGAKPAVAATAAIATNPVNATAAPLAVLPAASTPAASAAPVASTTVGEGKPAPLTPGVTIRAIPMPTATILPPLTPPTAAVPVSDSGHLEAALKSGKLLVILPLFALLGLGLSFTPCVLPMVPILSSIIVGEGANSSRGRGLLLSVTYSLGMAIVYTALGVAAGLAGEGLAAALQNPWVLGAFGLLMAALSLSMFGFYELQVPAALQSKLSTVSNRQSSGKLAGVFVMGAISALIVGPCVAAPLAAALVYISQSRDIVIGGSALFAMAVGMSVPLMLVGVSAGALLPRAGMWMDAVKRFFGVLMLAMGWWLVSPVLPAAVQMMGWAALLVGYGMYLLMNRGKWVAKAAGVIVAVLGLMQLVGVVSGGRDPLAPLAHLTGGKHEAPLAFQRIKTVQQLDAVLAQTGGKSAVLDFYADWCVSCKEMEKLTFVDPQVRARLANSVLLQVDVTANDADDKAMLKRFGLFGPPGIILFDQQGKEIDGARVIGFQDAAKFTASLARLN